MTLNSKLIRMFDLHGYLASWKISQVASMCFEHLIITRWQNSDATWFHKLPMDFLKEIAYMKQT